ncbi:MAG: hypothetical protein K2H67_06695 [Treponemataceae bacterium]|nr:hypothetical protein [Treponemataceae bacterium]
MNFFKRGFLILSLPFLAMSYRRGTSELLEASRGRSHGEMLRYLYENVGRKDLFPNLCYMEGDERISVVCVLCRNNSILAFEYREYELLKHSRSKSAKIKKKDIALPFRRFCEKYGPAAYSYSEDGTEVRVYMKKYASLVFPPLRIDAGISRQLTKVLVKDGIIVDIEEVTVANP